MRIPRKVKAGLRSLSDSELLSLVRTVEEAMKDNSNFENPTPSLESFSEFIEDYNTKLLIANKPGSPEDTQSKNEARKALEKVIDGLVFYVNSVAMGKLSVLLSSGFPLSKSYTRVLLPTMVKNIVLKDGRQKEQMLLNFEAQKNILIYRYRYTDNLDELGKILWTGKEFETTSSRNNLIAPVISGRIYYISVQAINSVGTSDWGEPVSWMVR